MKLLLDTHVLLWWLLADPRLPAGTLQLLTDEANELFLASVSGFEIVAKSAAGKLSLPLPPQAFVGEAMRRAKIREVPLRLEHTYRLASLPPVHRDPFDRLLVAVAQVESLVLLTDDPWIRRYPVATEWRVR